MTLGPPWGLLRPGRDCANLFDRPDLVESLHLASEVILLSSHFTVEETEAKRV